MSVKVDRKQVMKVGCAFMIDKTPSNHVNHCHEFEGRESFLNLVQRNQCWLFAFTLYPEISVHHVP